MGAAAGRQRLDEEDEFASDAQANNLWGTYVNGILQRIADNDSSLVVIRLGGKKLGRDGARTLYTALQTNSRIVSLDVSRNELTADAITYVSKSMYENEHITELRVGGNPLGPDGVRHFVTPLLHNAALRRFDLRRSGLGKKGCVAVAEILHFNNSITDIDLSSNGLGPDGVKEIAASLPHTYTLTRLSLAGNAIGDKGLHHVTDALTRNRALTALDIGFNGVTAGGLAYFITMLPDIGCKLSLLDLSGNPLNDDGCRAFCEQLGHLRTLTTLSLRRTGLTDAGCSFVSDALRHEQCDELRLHDLDLSENAIGREGVDKLCEMLRVRSSLAQLDLTGNEFGKDGGKALIRMLERNTAVTLVFLGACGLNKDYVTKIQSLLRRNREVAGLPFDSPLAWTVSPATAAGDRMRFGEEVHPAEAREDNYCESLFRRLRANAEDATQALLSSQYLSPLMAADIRDSLSASRRLAVLDLSANSLASEGVHTIAHGLKANKTLRQLSLAANHINSDGAKDIADYLRSNASLTAFTIADNPLRDEGVQALLGAVERHPLIRTFSVEWCKFTAASGDALKATLSSTTSLQALLLTGNQLANGGLIAVAEGLRKNRSLTQLDLAFTTVGDEGVEALVQTGHPRLQYIDLSQNSVTPPMIDRVRAMIDRNEIL